MGKDYHAQMPGKRFSSANNRPEEGIWGRITTPRCLEKKISSANNRPEEGIWGRITTPRWRAKDFLQLTTDQKKAYGKGLPRPDGWKRLSSPNNRPEEGIWGRVTTPRCLEKDSLQLATDQKKAYGEGLPRPDGWEKISFSQQPTRRRHMGKGYHAQTAGKRFSSANNRPEECIWGRITTPRWLEKRFSSANNRPEEGIWGRITTPRWQEKISFS